ncbi:uncharacterized protein LOC141613413 [Silene latifolia]|uniref:uncharacterized protein LOC141613413 n=1 Tax=Silene latifolia TaxID=37657 RepID=UPI003D781AB3
MEDSMRECMKKLAIWYTKSFKPLITHDELEPIMAVLGFVGQPDKPAQNGVVWKEYVYAAGALAAELSIPLPRPKLPSHRIDGLHIYTYRAFIDAVNFYLDMDDISDLFHIRGMPLHRTYDRNKRFRRMDGNESVFVYREGTLDQSTYNYYHVDKNDANGDNNNHGSVTIRNKGKNLSIGTIVQLKDIIVWTLE